jgi:hypothetical protein
MFDDIADFGYGHEIYSIDVTDSSFLRAKTVTRILISPHREIRTTVMLTN